MDEHQNPEEGAESGKDHLRAAAGNLKEAASAKVEDIRQAAGQKADELRSAYVRDNPTKAVLIALGLGLLLGLLLRK